VVTFNERLKLSNLGFIFFILVYASAILYLSYSVTIWEDEAYTLNTTSLSLGKVISESYHFEAQPPVYFFICALWRLINPEIYFARLLSAIFIAFSALTIYKISKLFTSRNLSRWVTIVFLLNPFTLWASIEIRLYALVVLLSAISLYYFLQYLLTSNKKHFFYLLLVSLIGLYVQYFFAFLILVYIFVYLLYKGIKPTINFIFYFIPILILFLPNIYMMGSNLSNAQSQGVGYTTIQRLTVVFNSFQNVLLGIHVLVEKTILRWLVRIMFIVGFAYPILLMKRQKTKESESLKKVIIIIVLAIMVVLSLFTVVVFITGIKFNNRYLALVYPAIILLFLMFDYYNPKLRAISFSGITVYFITLLLLKYSVPVKTYDYESLAGFLKSIENPNEPIIFNSRTNSAPFEYYYTGKNLVVEIPDSMKFSQEGFQVLLRDTNDVKSILDNILATKQSVIIVNDNMIGYPENLRLNLQQLSKYLTKNYAITFDTVYYGRSNRLSLYIRRLENKPRSVDQVIF
jgi:mannosyltransferase